MPFPSIGPSETPPSTPEVTRRRVLGLGAGVIALGTTGPILAAGSAGARTTLRRQGPGSDLQRQVDRAAAEFGVPADLLMAVAWVNTRGRMPAPSEARYEAGDLHGRGHYGPAGLVRNPFSDTVGKASRLTGIPARQLMTERGANLRGGAAVLSRLQRSAGASSVLEALAGSDLAYGDQLRQALAQRSWAYSSQLTLDDDVALSTSQTAAPSKPSVTWYPAHDNNYTSANRPRSHPIKTIVIHVAQGSWSGTLSWFQNPNARVSAHYTVRSSDGRIGQSLSDVNIGWHAGNWTVNQTSIGIEHEGYVSDASWFTSEMYDRSALLTAYLCRRYGIPIDRSHIIGHNEVPGATHTDPGPHWRWRHYMRRVRSYA